jgi:uncharacterized protein YciI
MPTVVHCQDSSNARSGRERSYDAHIEYLRTIKDRIRFAGPLARADGARAQGDESLVGSLFVIDETASVTFELLQSDPYVISGVWDRVTVFQALQTYGPWPCGVPQKPQGHLYAALAGVAGPPLVAAPAILFGADLQPQELRPGEAGSGIWCAVSIFSAGSLDEARTLLVRDSEAHARQVECWALPIAVGTWTRTAQAP